MTACLTGVTPPVNAWTAARYTLPGLVAHRSALAGDVQLDVRDFGDAPDQDGSDAVITPATAKSLHRD